MRNFSTNAYHNGEKEVEFMKKKALLLILLAACVAVLQRCQPTHKNNQAGDSAVIDRSNKDTSKKDDKPALENEIQTAMFIETAAQGSILKVTLGKLALEKANDPEVKNFGILMVQDHSEMNDKLKKLAGTKGFKLPFSLSRKELDQVKQMGQMKPVYFEKLYMKMMIEHHDKHIELFKGAGNSPDTAVSNFSKMYLPVLEKHKEQALKVREGIKE